MSLLEYVGDLGGLLEILLLLGAFTTGFIIDRQFIAALATETYQIQNYTRNKSVYNENEAG